MTVCEYQSNFWGMQPKETQVLTELIAQLASLKQSQVTQAGKALRPEMPSMSSIGKVGDVPKLDLSTLPSLN